MKMIKNYLIALLILGIAVSCGKKEPVASDSAFIKLSSFVGEVKIKTGTGEKPAAAGDQLSVTDMISTGKSSMADLLYGAEGIIRVQENTTLSVASLADKSSNKTSLSMEKGKVMCTFAKLKKSEFSVKTPTAIAAVRGTTFSVAFEKGATSMAVVKGAISMKPVVDDKVIENFEAKIEAGQKIDKIDEKAVREIVELKKPVPVTALSQGEKTEIKKSFETIAPETLKNVDSEIHIELDVKMDKEPEAVKKDDEALKAQQAASIKARESAAAKKKEEAEEKQRQEEAGKAAEEARIKAEAEAIKKEEKKKKDRASNIPSI